MKRFTQKFAASLWALYLMLAALPAYGQTSSHGKMLLSAIDIEISGLAISDGDMHANEDLRLNRGLPSELAGHLSAVDRIRIRSKNAINGDVKAGGKLENGGVITGAANGNAPVSAIALPVLVPFSAGSNDVTVAGHADKILAPGSYGEVIVERDGTLRLSSGSYFMDELDFGTDTKLIVDASGGTVTVNIVSALHFGDRMVVSVDGGSDQFTINSLQSKNIRIDRESTILGNIIAPNAKLRALSYVHFRGTICAKDIRFNTGGAILSHTSGKSFPNRLNDAPQDSPGLPDIVDEPMGAGKRHSLGGTLYHFGRNADMIVEFQQFVANKGLSATDLLPASELQAPPSSQRYLIEPENASASGWTRNGDYLTSGTADIGPTAELPLRIDRDGFYRMWIGYQWRGERAVTRLDLYRAGKIEDGPLLTDEYCDQAVSPVGLHWKDLMVELEAGDYLIKLSHTRQWHWHTGTPTHISLKHEYRFIDCIYITDEIGANAPTNAERQAILASGTPVNDIQWNLTHSLTPAEQAEWVKWRLRPAHWDQWRQSPRLFEESLAFWYQKFDELSQMDYTASNFPDYREARRQVTFYPPWNYLGNPVRISRQIAALKGDILPQDNGHVYHWLHAGEMDIVEGQWQRQGGSLMGEPQTLSQDTKAEHNFWVGKTGNYHVWVRFKALDPYYAPWKMVVTNPNNDQITHIHNQPGGAYHTPPAGWALVGSIHANATEALHLQITPLPYIATGAGGTYRYIYDIALTTDPGWIPDGTTKPAITRAQHRQQADLLGAGSNDGFMMWLPKDVHKEYLAPAGWPRSIAGTDAIQEMTLAKNSRGSAAVHFRSLSDTPVTLDVDVDLQGFPGEVEWRVIAFAPYGEHRTEWSPIVLMRRPDITIPPLNNAGIWLSVNTENAPPGNYSPKVTLTADGLPPRTVTLNIKVSEVEIAPQETILLFGWTPPEEGLEYMQDYVDHGLNVWPGQISKAEMDHWGIKLAISNITKEDHIASELKGFKDNGLGYEDFIFSVEDEPTDGTVQSYIDLARKIRAADPNVRISFNPGEPATLFTFSSLAPYADFWIPYDHHFVYHPYEAAAKKAIFMVKPYMWYTTPVYQDKAPYTPGMLYDQIRSVPSRPCSIEGTAFFAPNYPFRDHWDTAYPFLADDGVMVLPSRHGPIPTRAWEAIREASQHANLAQMVKERAADPADPAIRKLIVEGSVKELIEWLEQNP